MRLHIHLVIAGCNMAAWMFFIQSIIEGNPLIWSSIVIFIAVLSPSSKANPKEAAEKSSNIGVQVLSIAIYTALLLTMDCLEACQSADNLERPQNVVNDYLKACTPCLLLKHFLRVEQRQKVLR